MFAKPLETTIAPDGSGHVVIFPVETSFHRMARRPGGIPREKALRNAKTQVLRLLGQCFRPAGDLRRVPVRAVPVRCVPRSGYLSMMSGFRFD